ncbi:hypothetical protein FQN52_005997 [Onygenales sp. PD_12]|nr:hypothetical protein FQN52_005997 [Onygenales sp. PD_12]
MARRNRLYKHLPPPFRFPASVSSPRVFKVYTIIALLVTFALVAPMYINPALLLGSLVWTSPAFARYPTHDYPTPEDPLKLYTISADGIQASFIPYGATLTSLLVNDKDGKQQDVVVGYDDPKKYVTDSQTNHTYFGCIVGRYANRIKNGSFELDGVTYDITKNENKDTQTLHGGIVGYDQRNWTVANYTDNSITFSLLDTGFEGFPGDVITYATYTVSANSTGPKPVTQMTAKTVSIALNHKTPIMLAHHIYWNLNAFKEPNVLEDTTLQLPLSNQFIEIDGSAIPTGKIADVATAYDGALDFTKPKLIGKDIEAAKNCGANCTGYDNAWLINRPTNISDWTSSPETMALALNMSSSATGISMTVTTNQKAIQIYSCNNQNGTIPVKPSQVKRNEKGGEHGGHQTAGGVDTIDKYGCLVIETEGWIDAINFPQWNQDNYQIYSPATGPAVNLATYEFGTI